MRDLKITFLIFLFVFVNCFQLLAQREYFRDIHKAYELDSVKKVKITSRFGSFHVVNDCVDSVRFDVRLSINSQSEEVAEKLLDLIEVQWDSIVPEVGAHTVIDPLFRPKEGFSIDFRIAVPADCELDFELGFADIFIDSLQAPGKFILEHGSFEGKYLEFPEDNPGVFDLAYSKVRLNDFSKARVNANFSKVFAGTGNELQIEGSYSGWNLDSVQNINGISANDGFRLQWVDDFNVAASRTNFEVRSIGRRLKFTNDYGSCIVNGFSPEFEKLELENKYGDVVINVSKLTDVFYWISTFQSNVLIPERMEIHKDILEGRTIFQSDSKIPGAPVIQINSDYGAVELAF